MATGLGAARGGVGMDESVVDRLLRTADKVEIMEVLSRYHQLVDSKDIESLGLVFTDDARCEYLGQEELFGIRGDSPTGLPAIQAFLADALAPVDTRHNMTNHVFVSLEGDHAHTRSYLIGRGGTEGVYEVDHVRTPDGWRMQNLVLEQRFDPETVKELLAERQRALAGGVGDRQ
ncbi:MAG: nuclear transport factor 2 family protein [Actinobacteria bacterium]|nr:nuclear transport factor 2 family protein [Actinomycetota bacterium]